ncbi:meiotic recombination protein REC8 homolog [Chiroxiphia lanceolata]|uniref:meiotic recombination protein REC8 homolog n=1 Tax=Chiroxiphia lanceolata TaxID=296741 RepID=UPI0013CECC69|nr:meiotic recombination protein REC8 homolog [Chiroxiphia lanceolata]
MVLGGASDRSASGLGGFGWVLGGFGWVPTLFLRSFRAVPLRLAATCSSRLLRREYLAVDVPRTCASVVSFVNGRSGWEVPPPPAGAPPPRCSLYLAAMLQLGLVRVYVRQCGNLLEDASQILDRLHRARPPLVEIDMSPSRRTQLLPDSQALMVQLELAPDPFFGVMGVELPQVEELLPPPIEIEFPPGPPVTVSPEYITLREPEVPPLPPPLEEELPEVTPRELQLLLEAEAEELLPPVEELEELPAPPPIPRVPPPEEPALPPPIPEVPVRRRIPRRRLPPHMDLVPHISPKLFRAQLLQPQAHCQPLVLLEPPHRIRRPPSELLNAPTHDWLPPELWELWGRCAQRPAPPAAPPPELPSDLEVLREALEPSLPTLISEVSLEPLEEEPLERLPPAPPIVPELPELPEVVEAPPDLRRLILEHAQHPGGSELTAMLPPGSSRAHVAKIFALCLELCGAHWVRLDQPRPYGPITVSLRPRPE